MRASSRFHRLLVVSTLLLSTFGVAAANAQPGFVGVVTGNNGEGNFTHTVGVPSGVAGDLLVAVVGVEQNPSTPTPGGWTAVPDFTGFNDAICASGDGIGIRCQLSVFYKIATAASEGSVSWTFGPNPRSAAGAILRYNNFNTTSPIGATGDQKGAVNVVPVPFWSPVAPIGLVVLKLL